MKAKIHPTYYSEAQVICSCGNKFTVGSTKETMHVELCYKCHPFYTGEMKFVDTLGRVEKFQKKQTYAQKQAPILKAQKLKKKHIEVEDKRPKTLREMLLGTS